MFWTVGEERGRCVDLWLGSGGTLVAARKPVPGAGRLVMGGLGASSDLLSSQRSSSGSTVTRKGGMMKGIPWGWY